MALAKLLKIVLICILPDVNFTWYGRCDPVVFIATCVAGHYKSCRHRRFLLSTLFALNYHEVRLRELFRASSPPYFDAYAFVHVIAL